MEVFAVNTLDSFEQAREQLLDLPPGVTLVILHPDFHGQHRLLAPVFAEANIPTVFTTVPASDYTLSDFIALLAETLQTQTNAKLPQLSGDVDKAAAAIADVLKKQGPMNLILDAYDRARQSEVAPFMTSLTQRLKDGVRVILGGRELPMELLTNADIHNQTALVPVNDAKMLLDYTQAINKNLLEVRALGPGRVLINGRLVDHWDGVLPRTLFFYFVDRGMTTRDEIFHTFWPTLSTREATNVFHVTKRKISEILGVDLTVYWSGFYRISPDLELHYDVVKFVEAVQNAAVADDEDAIALLQNGIELYNGPFLSTMEQDWVGNRRGELATTYAEALAGLARIYKNHDYKPKALGCFLRAAATSPQREDLARAIMELYRDLGRPDAALETYERLADELHRSLGVSPGPQTSDLANEIRRM
jgi:DNA-binding SARP family transcriptional activator